MATRNIVPRANNEGNLGRNGKRWLAIYAGTINADTLNINGNLTVDGTPAAGNNVINKTYFETELKKSMDTKLDKTDVVTTATANKVLRANGDGKLPTDITGNAATADTLKTARTIAVKGAVTAAGVAFNGSTNIELNATEVNAENLHGVVPDESIPNIPATKITGELTAANLPAVPAGKVTGELAVANIPDLPGTKIKGELDINNISSIPAEKIEGINMLRRNKAYAVGDIAYSPNLPSWAYLECKTAGTTGANEPDFTDVSTTGGASLTLFTKTDGSVVWRLRDKRCRYQLGQIVSLLTTPNAYDYLILCDGSAIDVEKCPLLDGVFPNNTLPNLTDGRFLEGGTAADKGKTHAAGLPDIKGYIPLYVYLKGSTYTGEDFSGVKVNNNAVNTVNQSGDNFYNTTVTFKASNSNPIYGASTTVQPKSLIVNYYINYGG